MSHVQSVNAFHQNEQSFCNAKAFLPIEKRNLALKAILNQQPITELAKNSGVSRKFIYLQKNKAIEALNSAFIAPDKDNEVLYTIPVTRNFIQASALSLSLNCHSSERGIVQHFKDIYDYEICEGNAHNILAQVAQRAAKENEKADLTNVKIGAHDEIFQGSDPILVGCDAVTTYIYILLKEKNRDAFAWAFALLMCQENGLDLNQVIADFGTGLRAGLAAVWPDLYCDADVFHILMELGKTKKYLENRAIGAIAKTYELEKNTLRLHKQTQTLSKEVEKNLEKIKTKASHKGKLMQLNIFSMQAPVVYDVENNIVETNAKILALEEAIMNNQKQQNELNHSIEEARTAEGKIINLVDIFETATNWIQHDILSVAGPDHTKRCNLFDFIRQALIEAEKVCPSKHVRKMIIKLKNQRDHLLRFVLRNDIKLAAVAENLKIAAPVLRELYELQGVSRETKYFWDQEQKLRKKIGTRFHLAMAQINEIIAETVRASSIVENINSRLRAYFFLRKSFGQESLELLRFYLNHKTFLRSEHPDRVGKSPAELLTGKAHPHWLEMLGFKLFKRDVAIA
jgi:hypothetical protein